VTLNSGFRLISTSRADPAAMSSAGRASLGCWNEARYRSGAKSAGGTVDLSGGSVVELFRDQATTKLSDIPTADAGREARQPPQGSLPVLGLTALGARPDRRYD
jgi:hypothetical protein